ncbi:MAG: hypothetical protein HZB68_03795 [Candidatus Aenigmarchaeota archaeon]|nr:hypothetical protein [Candidatus Aenigmarchaeota archaeon]
MNMSLVTKEELEEVLKELGQEFKHIEPHVIILLYTYIKKKKLENNSPT